MNTNGVKPSRHQQFYDEAKMSLKSNYKVCPAVGHLGLNDQSRNRIKSRKDAVRKVEFNFSPSSLFLSLFICLLAFDFSEQHTKTGKKLPAKHDAAPLNSLFISSSATSSLLTVHRNDGRSEVQCIRWKSSL